MSSVIRISFEYRLWKTCKIDNNIALKVFYEITSVENIAKL